MTHSVTHLISKCFTFSEKLSVAIALGLPVLSVSWVFEIAALEKGGTICVDAKKLEGNHVLKPLAGAVISLTGIETEKRAEIAQIIAENGGSYSPDLTRGVSHLVSLASVKGSKKLEYAVKWNITVVNADWINDRVKHILKKDSEYALNALALSSQSQVSRTEESSIQTNVELPSLKANFLETSRIMIYVSEEIKGDLHGLLKKLILDAGGMRSGEWDASSCTHFLTKEKGALTPSETKLLSEENGVIVHHQWLLDCNEAQTLLPTAPYAIPHPSSLTDDVTKIASFPIQYNEEVRSNLLFADLECSLSGFSAEYNGRITSTLSKHGAKVVSKAKTVICPFFYSQRMFFSVKYLSPFWIEACLNVKKSI